LRRALGESQVQLYLYHAAALLSEFYVQAGEAVVLRSACTPAAVTLEQRRRSSEMSAGRMLNARTPTSVTLHPQRLRYVSAGRLSLLGYPRQTPRGSR
jgi:hypothetical protein